jgi:competence protein ComEC
MMTGLVMIAVMVDRSPISMRLVSFSAFCILMFVPQALVGVSFQMSFAAVAAIISFFEYIKPWWMRWYSSGGFIRKSLMYLIAVLLTSVIAGGVTGFFSLYHFQTFAVYGVLSNMMAVPLTAFIIMPAAVVSVLAMPLGLSAMPLKIMEWGVLKLLVIAHWAAGFDDAVLRVEQWPVLSLFLFCIGFLLFLLWSGWYGKAFSAVFIALSFVFGALTTPASIMVSGSGKLMGVRQGEYLYVTSARKEKFSSEGWARLSGLPKEHIKSFYDKVSPVSCDEYACRYVSSGGNVSFVKKEQAVREECAWADIIISQVPILQKVCKAMSENSIYDLYDFKKNGAYAFYVGDGGFRAESVNERAGDRPWK